MIVHRHHRRPILDRRALLIGLAVTSFVAAGCGSSSSSTPAATTTTSTTTTTTTTSAATTTAASVSSTPSGTAATAPAPTPASAAPSAPTTTTAPPSGGTLASLQPQIEAILTAALAPNGVKLNAEALPGNSPTGVSVGVRVSGQPDLLVAAGTQVDASAVPFSATAPFAASFNTEMTTLLIGWMMVDDGTLDPKATIDRWLPKFPNAKSITIEMLLDHTDGMVDMNAEASTLALADLRKHWTLAEVLDTLASLPPAAPAGTVGTNFSEGTGGVALAFIMEQVTGKDIAAIYQQRLIGPLGLTSTQLSATVPAGYQFGTFQLNGEVANAAHYDNTSYLSFGLPVWGMSSTLGDQLTLTEAIGAGKVPGLTRSLRADSFTTARVLGGGADGAMRYPATGYPVFGYCPCTTAGANVTPTAIGRRGNSTAAITQWFYFPAKGISVVVHFDDDEVDIDAAQGVAYSVEQVVAATLP